MNQLLPVHTQRRVRLRADDFLLLDGHGAFSEYRKTELIDGDVYGMNAQHRPHLWVKGELWFRLRQALAISTFSDLHALSEGSIRLTDHDVPEPDILLTSEPRGEGMVPGSSVALLIEVSDTTLEFDLGKKLHAYAAAGVPEYWVADVNGRVLHQMWSPAEGVYQERCEVPFAQTITARTLPGLTIATDGL